MTGAIVSRSLTSMIVVAQHTPLWLETVLGTPGQL